MNVAILVRTIATFSWLLVIASIAIAVTRASRGRSTGGAFTLTLVTLAFAAILSIVSMGLVFIQPEERGLVITASAPGYRTEPLQPGLRWIMPFFESVKIYKISRQTYTMSIAPNEGAVLGDDSITARTSDGQQIYIDASVIYAIDPSKVVQVHIEWQDRYQDELIRPLARGVIRDAVSQYGVEAVITSKRFELASTITEGLRTKLDENGLTLVEFIIRNLTFSDEYAASVEQKQIAEQQAQQAKFVVEQRKQEAEQARQTAEGQADAVVIRAQGDADARLIQADAEAKALGYIAAILRDNPDLLTYQYITKLSPNVQVMLLPSNGTDYFYPLPTLDFPTPSNVPAPTTEAPAPTPTAVP